jgi:hypothetical protein
MSWSSGQGFSPGAPEYTAGALTSQLQFEQILTEIYLYKVGWEEVVYQEMSNNIYQHDSY